MKKFLRASHVGIIATVVSDSARHSRIAVLFAVLALALSAAGAADTYVAKAGDFNPANPEDGAIVTWNGANGGPVSNLIFGADAFTSIQSAVNVTPPGGTVHIGTGAYDEDMEITIAKSLTVQGDGASATIVTGGEAHRVFDISEGPFDVVLDGLRITNGRAMSGTALERSGGGIRSASTGSVTVANSTLSGNRVGIEGFWGGSGGGISATGSLTVMNSTLYRNYANSDGGGISATGSLTVTNSIFSFNGVYGFGGGINCSGALSIVNSTLSGNDAFYDGGGLVCSGSVVTVVDSTISGNHAQDYGGGIANHSAGSVTVINSTLSGNRATWGEGGAISHRSTGSLTVANSTLSGNVAELPRPGGRGGGGGGAIGNRSTGSVTVVNSTISGNSTEGGGRFGSGGGIYNFSTGGVTVANSIVAGNLGPDPDVVGGAFTSNGANFIGVDSSVGNIFTASGDKTFANTSATVIGDVILPVADNGGATMTHALAAGSLAIDMGNDADIPAGDSNSAEPAPFDQRGPGFPRIVGYSVDIGAYESAQLLGDMNGNGRVNVFDIDWFVRALVDPAGYTEDTGLPPEAYGDINGDGVLNSFDIDPFVTLLTGGAPETAELLAPLLAMRRNISKQPGAEFKILGCNRSSSGVQLKWTSEAGELYIIEHSRTARPDSWKPVDAQPAQAGDTSTTFMDTDKNRLSMGESYYRIRVLH